MTMSDSFGYLDLWSCIPETMTMSDSFGYLDLWQHNCWDVTCVFVTKSLNFLQH